MPIAARLAAGPEAVQTGLPCSVGDLLSTLPESEREALQTILDDKRRRIIRRSNQSLVTDMKINYVLALVLASVSAPVLAQAPAESAVAVPAVKRGAMVFTADGRRVGRVDRVRSDAVGIIYNGKYIDVPTATLAASERGLTTSLNKDQLGKN